MKFASKTVLAATALTLGLAAAPASAQVLGYDRDYGYADRTASGIDDTGRLNVFGARIDPRSANGGILGGVGNVVGGVVGGVGTAVGGVVGGATGAADDLVTGSVGGRDGRYTAAQERQARRYDAQAARGYSRPGKYDHPFTPTVRN